jgi:hypothetical protein
MTHYPKLQAPVRLQLLPELVSFLFCIAVSFISVSSLLKKSKGNGPEGEGGRENFTSFFNLENMISTDTQRFLLNKWL